jgi:purine-binding chemotaxis protein CheW
MRAAETALTPVADTRQYVTLTLDGQLFGIPVLLVHDVLRNPGVNHIPLAPLGVAGSLNLRGRIVTAIDARRKLGLPAQEEAGNAKVMCVVVEHSNEMYGLLVDEVSDVLSLEGQQMEKVPGTLDPAWREVCQGIYKLDGRLLLILETGRLFALDAMAAA